MLGTVPYRFAVQRWLTLRAAMVLAMTLTALSASVGAQDRVANEPAASAPVNNSQMDAQLFFQVLVGEMELNNGNPGAAYEWLLDAARRQGDDELYQRAVEIALQERAGEQALAAAKAWRTAHPKALGAVRYQAQILLALNRTDEAIEPLAAWLAAVPAMERPGLIASLPRLLQSLSDRQRALGIARTLLSPYLANAATRTASRVALGRFHLLAGQPDLALTQAREAQAAEPTALGPALLAVDLASTLPAAESVVTQYLAGERPEPAFRLAYVRLLTQQQRYADAAVQLEKLIAEQPLLPEPWLTLGAIRLDLKQPKEAEQALQKFLALAQLAPTAPQDTGPAVAVDDDESNSESPKRDLTQAWLLLAQAAEQRGDAKASEAWLAKIDNPQRLLEVQVRRASLLARQGKVHEGRALITGVPERTGDDARAKLMAEAQLLREIQQWSEAAKVLLVASQKFPSDIDVVYEQAMVEEKLEHWDAMERLLRRVISLKPDHPHAHNALGYSFADRGVRLPEALELIQQALKLAPGDPFITDSLGWVEFRMGNRESAISLLRQAWNARPDTEIAAHLGEVLWAAGQHEEARRVWLDARRRDAVNEVLRETLTRLKVAL